jgi:hypothetical protein
VFVNPLFKRIKKQYANIFLSTEVTSMNAQEEGIQVGIPLVSLLTMSSLFLRTASISIFGSLKVTPRCCASAASLIISAV